MIDLVIDRTETDVLLGNSKGIYQAEDLNRVGQAVEELAALLPQLDLQTAVAPKTDWAPPEAYDPDKWIRTANMAVYLANVTTLLSTMRILAPADFPVDMNFLTYRSCKCMAASAVFEMLINTAALHTPERRQDYDGSSTRRTGTVHSNHYRK